MKAFRRQKRSGSKRHPTAGLASTVSARKSLWLEHLEQRCVLSTWQPIGPSPILNGQVENVFPGDAVVGAVQTVVAHPTNPNVLYVGTTNGGVWKTLNASSSLPDWVPLTDDLPSLSIRDLRMDPTNPDRLIASVGLSSSYGTLSSDGQVFRSEGGELVGLYLTHDGGETWLLLSDPLFEGESVRSAEIRGDTIIMGTTDAKTNGTHDAEGGGLYRSTDGGNSWSKFTIVKLENDDIGLLDLGVARERCQNLADDLACIIEPGRTIDLPLKYSVMELTADPSPGGDQRYYALVVASVALGDVDVTQLEEIRQRFAADAEVQNRVMDEARGIYMTQDGGATWVNMTHVARRDPITDGEFESLAVIPPPDIQDAILGRMQRRVDAEDDTGVVGIVEVPYLDEQGSFAFPGDLNNAKLSVSADGGRLFALIADSGVVKYIGYADVPDAISTDPASDINGLVDIAAIQWQIMDLPLIPGEDSLQGLNPRAEPGSRGSIHLSLLADPNDRNIVYVGGDQQDLPVDGSSNFIGATDFSGTIWRGDTTNRPSIGIIDGGDGDLFEPVGRELLDVQLLMREDNLVTVVQDAPSDQWSHMTHDNDRSAINDGGTANSSAPHADSRDLAMDAAGKLIEVDDGGIYRRTSPLDNTGDWFSLNNNLQVTEFHDVAYDTTSNIVFGGAQDVGSPQQNATDDSTWAGVQVFDLVVDQGLIDPIRLNADGGDVAVDDSSAYISYRYSSIQGAGFIRRQIFSSNNVFREQTFLTLPDDFVPSFVTPIEVNVVDGSRLIIVGENGIYESLDRGDTFELVTGIDNTQQSLDTNAVAYGGFRAGFENVGVIYVGFGSDIVIRTVEGVERIGDDGTGEIDPENVELTRADFPGGQVKDLVLDPDDWRTAYVTGSNGIWVTRDAGVSWTDMTGNMTASFVKPVQYIEHTTSGGSDQVVVGTNRGVFSMNVDEPGIWTPLSTDLPNALVYDLDYDATDDVLVAGTLGRGAFILSDVSAKANSDGGTTPVDPPASTMTGSVAGNVFGDQNSNGVQDAGEDGLAGIVVYVDMNNNGRISLTGPVGVTNANGDYVITGVPVGTQTIQIATSADDLFGTAATQTVIVIVATTTSNVNFGATPHFDYGDAPDPYPTQIAESGPSHSLFTDLYLGPAANLGMPGLQADGELDGQADDGSDDGDGVVFVSGLQPGATARIAVLANQPTNLHGYLNAWIDFNGGGDLTDPGEQVAVNLRLDNGVNSISIAVPAGASATNALARFRWSFDKDISFAGSAFGGEVEDYLVSIPMTGSGGSVARDDTFDAVEDMTVPLVMDVLANDSPDIFGGTLTVEIPPGQSVNGTLTTDGTQISYTPNANFNGTKTFVYDLVDSLDTRSTATVTINVESVNDPPTAVDDDVTVGADTFQNVLNLTANDLVEPDDNETLVITALGPTSAGGTLSLTADATGVRYSPMAGFLGTDTFIYMVSDGNGGTAEAMVTVEVVRPLFVDFRLAVTDTNGNAISEIDVGNDFQLRGFVEDTRPIPASVFSAYLDVEYDPFLVTTMGPTTFGAVYNRGTNDDFSTAGIINGIGATTDLFTPPPGAGEFLLFSVPFTARNSGTVTFQSAFEDNLPLRAVTLFGSNMSVNAEMITFGAASLTVNGITVTNDMFTVVEDSTNNSFDVLDNDMGVDPLEIATLLSTQPANGTAVVVELGPGEDRILYTPDPDFEGVDNFEYTVMDATGTPGTGFVTVNVTNLNDDPMAVDDTIAIESTNVATLDVLANDMDAPDRNEILTITGVTQPAEGGAVAISADGKSLEFTPNGVNTMTMFTYTISDGNGGSDTAMVNLEINDNVAVFRPQVTTLNGEPLSGPLEFGDEFLLSVFTRDRRNVPSGVFSAYLDVIYDPSLVEVVGMLDLSNGRYTGAASGSTAVAGVIDEVGGTDGTTPLGENEFLVFEVPFRVTSSQRATMTFMTDPADLLPIHEVTLFGEFASVDFDLIDFQTVDLQIEGDGARNDQFTVDEDTTTNLDVLMNDVIPTGLGPLTVDSVSQQPDAGGMATVIPDPNDPSRMVIEYTPTMDFPMGVSSDSETFKYLARDAAGTPTEGTVVVTVNNTPDLPIANDDSRIVQIGSVTQFNLQSNDTNDPDPAADLTIMSVTQPIGGGSVSINSGPAAPTTFTAPTTPGIVTFTYTVVDVDGLTDTATVTVDVSTNAPPTMGFLFEVTDTLGLPIDSVATGESFLLNVSVQDMREIPRGVFSAYLDVITTGTGTVTSDGQIQFNQLVFPSAQSGTFGTEPLVDELGAVDGTSAADPEGLVLLATIPLIATSVGDLTFTGVAADIVPPNETTLFGDFAVVGPDQQDFGLDSVSIVSPPASSAVVLDVDGNGDVTPFDALLVINELDGVTPQAASSSSAPPPPTPPRSRYDVNGDGNVTPLDALLVINELDGQSVATAPRSSSSSMAVVSDSSSRVERVATPEASRDATLLALNPELMARAKANLIRYVTDQSNLPAAVNQDVSVAALDHVFAVDRAGELGETALAATSKAWADDETSEAMNTETFDDVFSQLAEQTGAKLARS